MYSSINALGELPDGGWDDQYGFESTSDLRTAGADNFINEISDEFLSPPAGYPKQRINLYDVPLAEHQTLNGVGASRIPGRPRPFNFFKVGARTRVGAPRRTIIMHPLNARYSRGR